MSERSSETGKLVLAFWERFKPVLDDLRKEGFAPVVHETLRSKERAQALVKAGKSLAKGGLSMHCYGIAIDCVCALHKWSCHDHGCQFFERYGVLAEKRGLTWGGRWTTLRDLPHVQAVPVRLQALVRATDQQHMDTLVRAVFAGLAR